MPVVLVLGRLRQKNLEFEASSGYTVRLCLKNKKGEGYQICNPSYSGSRDWEDHGSRPAGVKVCKIPSFSLKKKYWAWWQITVIPAMWEV
jgi:hypothetical protein